MPRPKRNSQVLNNAEQRFAAMQSVTKEIDFGNGWTMEAYESIIQEMRQKLADYNRTLSMVDGAYSEMLEVERKLMDFSDHMLSGFGVRYGKDSYAYEMAGGRRKSERRKPIRRTTRVADEGTVG
ncbi:MAG: hypothetical protein ACFE0I_14245 [Elainellaceae cyanobacterium]